jgi:serine/threonine protein kinase
MPESLKANTTISHYRILRKLGAGGMGEVYLGQDKKLERKVALKILPAEVAANQERMRRFVQEAKAAATLNHPNIAHIYEIGEAASDGRAIIYFVTRNGVSNLWAQPVDGAAPKQLTNFPSDRIFWFDFSRDGKQLALSRGTMTSDVVLISNFK